MPDALSRKPCNKPRRTRSLRSINRRKRVRIIRVDPIRLVGINAIIRSNLNTSIRMAQEEALKEENCVQEGLKGLDLQLEKKANGIYYFVGKKETPVRHNRIWVPYFGNLRKVVLDEAHKSRYSIHP